MRIFERGIRRRMAPMFKGDRRRILLAFSLLLTLPGTPVFWYGEEIGMTEDLAMPERFSVRTPMQWSRDTNAGFSAAPPQMLVRPIASNDTFPFDQVNVESEEADPGSLLNAVQAMIRTRKQNPGFGCGSWETLKTSAPKQVLAHTCQWEGETLLAVHNFSGSKVDFSVPTKPAETGVAAELTGPRSIEIQDGVLRMQLEAFGFCWMRLKAGAVREKRKQERGAKKKKPRRQRATSHSSRRSKS